MTTCPRDGGEARQLIEGLAQQSDTVGDPILLPQGRAPSRRHPGDRSMCGNRLCRELGRHRTVWPKQAGLAQDLSAIAQRHSFGRHVPACVHAHGPDVREAGFASWAGSFTERFERQVAAMPARRSRTPLSLGGTSRGRTGIAEQILAHAGTCRDRSATLRKGKTAAKRARSAIRRTIGGL